MACWIFKKFSSMIIILYLWAHMNFYPYSPHLTNSGEILHRGINECLHTFYTFWHDLEKTQYRTYQQKFTKWQPVLWKSPPGYPTLLRGINEFLSIVSTFNVWWVISSIRHSHTMLLSISKFHKNWDRESPTFLTSINKIIFVCINHMTFRK